MRNLTLAMCSLLLVGIGGAQEPKSSAAPSDSWNRERCLTTGAGPRRLSYNFARCLGASCVEIDP
jgi:hypothetical protein